MLQPATSSRPPGVMEFMAQSVTAARESHAAPDSPPWLRNATIARGVPPSWRSDSLPQHSRAFATVTYGSVRSICEAAVLGRMLMAAVPSIPRVAMVPPSLDEALRSILVEGAGWTLHEEVVMRHDPHLTLSPFKLSLWRLPYKKLLFLDSDMVVMPNGGVLLRRLLDLPLRSFALVAQPEHPWSDESTRACFNSGLISSPQTRRASRWRRRRSTFAHHVASPAMAERG